MRLREQIATPLDLEALSSPLALPPHSVSDPTSYDLRSPQCRHRSGSWPFEPSSSVSVLLAALVAELGQVSRVGPFEPMKMQFVPGVIKHVAALVPVAAVEHIHSVSVAN